MSYNKPLPRVSPQSGRFWEAAKQERLELPRCDHCGTFHTYFEPWCNNCGHEGTHWEQLNGYGRIWANCRFHKPYFPGFEDDIPYNVAIVELDEGARLVTNIVSLPTGALDEMPIGMRVEAVFDHVTPDVALIKFKPAADRQESSQP